MITIGVSDDKLQQAISRHLLKISGFSAGSVHLRLFKDDENLREILGTTGIPFYEPVFDAVLDESVDACGLPAEYAPLFLPEGISISGAVYEDDPWVLVTQSGDDVLTDSAGTYTVGGMSRVALAWWKTAHPHHKIVRSQQDVHTRLQECSVGDWDAGIFRKSDLDLLSFEQHYDHVLAHAPRDVFQGCSVWLVKKENPRLAEPFNVGIGNGNEWVEAQRIFLRRLGAKPTAPVSFSWTKTDDILNITTQVFPPNGTVFTATAESSIQNLPETVRNLAAELLQQGAGEWVSGPHAED